MIYLGLLLTCLMGWILLPSRLAAGPLPKLSLAFASGAAAISVQLFAYDLLGLGWNVVWLLLPWVAAIGVFLYGKRKRLSVPHWYAPRWWQFALAAGLCVPIAVWLPYERVMPLTVQSWDAWAIWLFKAKAFYLDGGIDGYLSRGAKFAYHPGYPLLVPLYATFLYIVNGGVDDQTVKLFSPCFYLALLGVFYYFARRFSAPLIALVFTVMVASLRMVGVAAFGWAGYADTTLSLYLLAAAGFLAAWYREGSLTDLTAASLAATAAAWTKNEGQFFLLGLLLLAGARLLRSPRSARAWPFLLGPPVVVLVPWVLLRQSYGVEAAGFVPGESFHLDLFWTSARTLLAKALQLDSFNLAFYLFAASTAAAVTLRCAASFWMLVSLVLWHLGGALLAYATGRNNLDWWLQTSADRILAQIAPLAMLPPAIVFSRWSERTQPQSVTAAGAVDPSGMRRTTGRKRRRRAR